MTPKKPSDIYQYRDAHGRLVYMLARFQPKDFKWLRPDLKPCKASRRRPLLYRLPELLAAKPTRIVFICEGEKDVDRLRSLGLVAVCNDDGGGKGKWQLAHSRHLRGRHVVILPDNDRTGEEHAAGVARRLVTFAASVRVLRLPGLPRRGDVSDWLDAGGIQQELLRLAKASPRFNGKPSYDPPRNYEQHHIWLSEHMRSIIAVDLSPIEKLLLIILADHKGEDRWHRHSRSSSTPPQSHLAVWLGVTERRVRQLVVGRQKKGYLRVTRIGRENRYAT